VCAWAARTVMARKAWALVLAWMGMRKDDVLNSGKYNMILQTSKAGTSDSASLTGCNQFTVGTGQTPAGVSHRCGYLGCPKGISASLHLLSFCMGVHTRDQKPWLVRALNEPVTAPCHWLSP
jgi:hypothetical protein